MSRPNQGSYVIYNRVLSPTGDKLAITFTGQNNTLTVTPMTKSSNQVFNLSNNDSNTMFVVPQSSSGLQVGWGSNGATPMTPGGYARLRLDHQEFRCWLHDGGMSQNWHLDKAANNANVAIAADQGNERYRWVLEPVSQ